MKTNHLWGFKMRLNKYNKAIYALLCLVGVFVSQSMQSDDITTNLIHNDDLRLVTDHSQSVDPPLKTKNISEQKTEARRLVESKLLKSLDLPDGGGLQIVASIGLYQQPAVIRVQILNDNTINGGYMYLKHKKIIKLNGKLNGEFLDLTESYEGKTTGHLRINPLNPMLSEWLDPLKEYSGSFKVEHMEVMSGDAYAEPVSIQCFDRYHPIGIINGNDLETVNVTDDMDVLFLDDEKKMFLNIHVVASNAHMGVFTGLLEMAGLKSYEHRSPDCKINTSLMDDGILTIDEECRYCCGARATLSGSYPLNGVETYQLSHPK
ncbi:hypothetical protein OAM01_02865 [bacterium]|nr:hypothetical protein [bacterium]